MSEWENVNLGSLLSFGNGKSRPLDSGNIPVYGGNGIMSYVSQSNYDQETIIIGRVGAYCGATYYENKPIWISDNALSAKAIGKNNTKYLYYLLKNLDLNQFAEGSSHPLLTQKLLKSVGTKAALNPNEQKSIASVLSCLDDKIDLLHLQNKTLESMAEALFRQWFIEEAQEDWEITTLECHITIAKGLSYKGAGLTTSDNGIPLFNLNSVLEGGGYKSTGIKYYNGDFKERHIIKSGDIIVANTEQGHEYRLIGYPAIIPTTKSELSIYTHHLFKININDDSYLTNAFMYYLLCSKDMHEQVVAATNGSTVNQLSADGLQRPEFKLPPEYKVKDFTTQIASFWKKISINNSQIKNIESLRDTLLPKLMSSEVRVQYAEEAIASVA
ncbi:TPA: restriction endonuclease subunit S [Klebsiella variicola]|uniref:restriction endonuclease subunit S n=1 Tax=Klebsiella variicola TaxID=244366 RepID=UPI001253E1F2|nr:restriction endonuclease subunit S [Klebsiella variicola]VAN83968.1 restriction modification system DNA specificity domain-containing protein [Klebsiella variicola]HBS5821046.1 restriction endonuclease subunit S [Klebsiella variicola]